MSSLGGPEGVQLKPVPSAVDSRRAPALVHADVLSNRQITAEYWSIDLLAPEVASGAKPGQFVMLTLARQGQAIPVLPRPMAIYSYDEQAGTIQIVYKIVGVGTRVLTGWRPAEVMTIVGPLGVPFHLRADSRVVVLLGRGIGTCSLTALAQHAAASGLEVHAVASGRTPAAVVGVDFYRNVGVTEVLPVFDVDGSSGPAAVRNALAGTVRSGDIDQIFVCGSNRLLELASQISGENGAEVQVSIEAHMACGLGYCHGCASGAPGLPAESPLVCTAGPVFLASPASVTYAR